MNYYQTSENAFPLDYLSQLQGQILSCPYFALNNLNRDFIETKGFSLAFQRSGLSKIEQQFPFFKTYLDIALQPNCNAFYLNPLLLKTGSRVDPHIDRSLRSYCKNIEPPALVSVLYVQVPATLHGGELVLCHNKRQVGQIRPRVNTLLYFQGNLTHAVKEVTSLGTRLSLVCEQYNLSEADFWRYQSLLLNLEQSSRKLRLANKKEKNS